MDSSCYKGENYSANLRACSSYVHLYVRVRRGLSTAPLEDPDEATTVTDTVYSLPGTRLLKTCDNVLPLKKKHENIFSVQGYLEYL